MTESNSNLLITILSISTPKMIYLKTKTKLRAFSPQANYIERAPQVGKVSANFWG
jgi:hypothetical protein